MRSEEFKLYRTATASLLSLGIPIIMFVIGVFMLLAAFAGEVKSGKGGPPPVPFMVVWLGIVVFMMVHSLRMPTKIELYEGGKIVFSSRFRKTEIEALQVMSIKPRGNQIGMLALKHSGGTIYFLNQFDGFHRFLTHLRD